MNIFLRVVLILLGAFLPIILISTFYQYYLFDNMPYLTLDYLNPNKYYFGFRSLLLMFQDMSSINQMPTYMLMEDIRTISNALIDFIDNWQTMSIDDFLLFLGSIVTLLQLPIDFIAVVGSPLVAVVNCLIKAWFGMYNTPLPQVAQTAISLFI